MRSRNVILSGIMLLAVFPVFGQTNIPGGDVFGTWTKDQSPYLINGDCTVPENQSLVIEPGVEVIFQGHYYLRAPRADLIAVGTPGDMILFTMADTSGLVNGGEDEGGWNGIRCSYSSESGDTSRLEYCRFEYAKVIADYAAGGGVVGADRIPRLKVANCIFEYNYSNNNGVDCYLANVLIHGNIFKNNVGESLLDTPYSNPTFYNNRIENNSLSEIINVEAWSSPIIEKNILKNNTANFLVRTDGHKPSPVIRNNLFINNTINPVYWYYAVYLRRAEAKFYGNILANNSGNVIQVLNGNSQVINNTIVNNEGCPLHLETENTEFNGNIFYGNTENIYYIKGTTEPSFFNNIIEGGTAGFTNDVFTGPARNNIDTIPGFIDPTTGTGTSYDAEVKDFGLLTTSPAINNGDTALNEENFIKLDIYQNERVKYSYIDIGAAEASVPGDTIEAGNFSSNLTLIGDSIFISGDIVIDDDVVVSIAGGSRIIFTGPYSIDVNGTLLAQGTQNDTIWFTVEDTTGFSGPDYDAGCWKGISLDNEGSTMDDNIPSSFRFCVFEYGKTNTSRKSVFSLSDIPELSISHSVFRNNRGRDSREPAVLYSNSSKLILDNVSIISNHSDGEYPYGPLTFYGSEVNLTNSLFKYNTAGAGVCLYLISSNLYSSHNTFHNNSTLDIYNSGGILRAGLSEITIVNDLMVNNTSSNAAAYYFESCIASITNSTIVNNRNMNSSFTGGITITGTDLKITNSLLYGNRAGSSRSSIYMGDENTDPNLYNCLIEEGDAGIRTITGFSFTGDFIECIDLEPHFINPTPIAGYEEDASGSNWQLLDISPAINAGTVDTSGLMLTASDLNGNVRISNDVIDIGAFEKEGRAATITAEPVGGNFCTGDQIGLQVEYSQTDTVSFQWLKDGSSISGATDSGYLIDSVELNDEGNYSCVLRNSFGAVNTIPVFINVKAAPEILVEPDPAWVIPDVYHKISVFVKGSSPLEYRWYKNEVTIPGAILPEYRVVPSDSSFEGAYSCIVSNSCGADTTNAVDLFLAPKVCMVTVSEITGHNLVVWEKKSKAPVLAYNIYRESVAAGIYDLLATIPYDDLSLYVDTDADPTVQAYIYKITAVLDTLGNETDIDLCKPHKTVHLIVSTNPELNTTQLQWDRYYGFDYNTYTIYRSDTEINFTPIHSLSANNNSWTDPEPSSGDQFYRIAVEKTDPCVPEGGSKKAGSGPFVHSLSNMDDNKLKAGENPPDSIYLNNLSIDENLLPGSLVGRVVTIDLDSLDYYTYHLVPGEGDDDNASFTLIGDLLVSASSFDFETKNTYKVRIRTTDNAAYYLERAFVIAVNDVVEGTTATGNIPPDSVYLDKAWIDENNNFGDPIGMLLTADQDTSDFHSYKLVSGTGDDDNIMFMVTGNVLRAGFVFDFEQKTSYSIRVRSTDLSENWIERIFIIRINDVVENVGISQAQKGGMHIYPNPFDQHTTIVIPNNTKDPYRLILSDLSGQVFRIVEGVTGTEYVLKKENLQSGLYFIELRGPETYRGKLIIE